jgi:signal recognition particle subunit SRP54
MKQIKKMGGLKGLPLFGKGGLGGWAAECRRHGWSLGGPGAGGLPGLGAGAPDLSKFLKK